MEIIKRQEYLKRIERYFDRQTIVVLVGQRRVGKSCLLKSLCEEKQKESRANIIYIDKEKRNFDFIKTYQDLNEYLAAHWQEGKKNYILIDEVQDIAEFERSLRSFHTEPETEIVVTGSNAKMLSSQLTTLIGGRYKEIYVQSLSYAEFLLFHQLTDGNEALGKYISLGGMPGLVKIGLDDEDDVREYLLDVYHTVLLKDVVMRNSIRNVTFLDNLVFFMADNEGKLISASSISKYMKSQGESVTSTAVINYQAALSEAYVLSKVSRFDIHGKRIFESNDKYYFEDNGIRNAIVGGSREGDVEKVIENVVYQHLVRLGFQVYVGQLQAGEIDFVCSKPRGERVYVQTSYVIADEATRNREFGNLRRIGDNYPKYVISMTPLVDRSVSEGIIHLHLRRFLLHGLS